MNNIEQEVIAEIAKLANLEPTDIDKSKFDLPLYANNEKKLPSLGLDSLDASELVVDLEDRCNVSISPEEAASIKTIRDAINLVRQKMPNGKLPDK